MSDNDFDLGAALGGFLLILLLGLFFTWSLNVMSGPNWSPPPDCSGSW